MTNEQIQVEARAAVAKYFSGPVPLYNNCVEAVAELCRSLLSRAYTELGAELEEMVEMTRENGGALEMLIGLQHAVALVEERRDSLSQALVLSP